MRLLSGNSILLVFIIISHAVFAQENDTTDYNWPHQGKYSYVSSDYNDYKAVIINEYKEVCTNLWTQEEDYYQYNYYHESYSYYMMRYAQCNGNTRYTVLRKIKLLNEMGLEEYATMVIPDLPGFEIITLDARTIKPDGTVIDLEADDIKEKEISLSDIDEIGIDYLQFAIPGVEIGDEIESIFVLESENPQFYGEYIMESYLPIISSTFRLIFPRSAQVEIKTYNGLHKPVSMQKGVSGTKSFLWRNISLRSLKDQHNSYPFHELPKFRYAIRSFVSDDPNVWDQTFTFTYKEWHEVFKSLKKYYTTKQNKKNQKNYFDSYLKQMLRNYEDSSSFYKFTRLFNDISDKVEIKVLDYPDYFYFPGYYLKNNIISNYNLYGLYIEIFKALGIDYRFCFSREYCFGKIDTNFVTTSVFTDAFFVFYDDKGDMHYLYPSRVSKSYEIDELPIDLFGADALIVENTDSNCFEIINLPVPGYEDNIINRKIETTIDFDADSLMFNFNVTYMGAISTANRILFDSMFHNKHRISVFEEMLERDDDPIRLDTIYFVSFQNLFPFDYVIEYQGKYQNSCRRLEDSIYLVPLNEWLDHHNINNDQSSRFLDYYFSYPFQDIFEYTIHFEKPVEILNIDKLNTKINNKFGGFELEATQTDIQTLKINSKYCLKTNFLPKTDGNLIDEINEELNKIIAISLLVKEI